MSRKSRRELERVLEELADGDRDALEWFDGVEIVNGVVNPEAFGLTFDEAAERMADGWPGDVPDHGIEFYREHIDAPLRSDAAARAVAYALAVTADGTHEAGRQRALAFLLDDAGEGVPTA